MCTTRAKPSLSGSNTQHGLALMKTPLTRGSYAAFLRAPQIWGTLFALPNRPSRSSLMEPPTCGQYNMAFRLLYKKVANRTKLRPLG